MRKHGTELKYSAYFSVLRDIPDRHVYNSILVQVFFVFETNFVSGAE